MSERLDRAKALRQNLTDVERHVWRQLRNRRFVGFKFRRQVPLGSYIVDFVCFSGRLMVELDGGQHNEPVQKEHDRRRDQWLKSQGFRVLRIWNHEVFTDCGPWLKRPSGGSCKGRFHRPAIAAAREHLPPSPLVGEGGRAAAG